MDCLDSKQYHRRYNSNLVESNYHPHNPTQRISYMRDPHGLLSSPSLPSDTDIFSSKYFINIPNIRDAEGDIIMPDEYKKILKNGSIVVVNVFLKLYVLEI